MRTIKLPIKNVIVAIDDDHHLMVKIDNLNITIPNLYNIIFSNIL